MQTKVSPPLRPYPRCPPPPYTPTIGAPSGKETMAGVLDTLTSTTTVATSPPTTTAKTNTRMK